MFYTLLFGAGLAADKFLAAAEFWHLEPRHAEWMAEHCTVDSDKLKKVLEMLHKENVLRYEWKKEGIDRLYIWPPDDSVNLACVQVALCFNGRKMSALLVHLDAVVPPTGT